MNKFEELKERYQCVRRIKDDSLRDPKEEPYRSKYKAKEVLFQMKITLTKKLQSLVESDPDRTLYAAMLSVVYLQLGIIYVETEEPFPGETYLTKSYETITDHLHPKFIICSMNVRNLLGILWSQRSEPEKARSWLEGAEKVYYDFKRKSPSERPITFQELFEGPRSTADGLGEKEIERVFTLTKFYLAQIYGSLKMPLKSAIYCHETLRRQLEFNEYDPIDWALNSATLSQFFMERLLFTQARHHLAAASHMLSEYEETLKTMTGSEEEIKAKKEEFRHRSADVSRCWAKYGIFLLEYSKKKLNGQEEPAKENGGDTYCLKNLWFSTLNLCQYENNIVASDLVLFEDARQVFLVTQRHLNKAKEYYALESHASDHVQIVQDQSQLYKHLIAFEESQDNQCKINKRRIDMLQAVLKELNPKYYLQACRQLWFELGELYHDVMNVKFQRMKDSGEVPQPQALKKINFLAEQSIKNFTEFLDSFKDKQTKTLPEKLDEEMVKPILIAHFFLGRLYYKMITQDKRKEFENTTKSYESLKYLVDYCDKSQLAGTMLSEELNVSKEMMILLQLKMLQI